MNKSKVDPVYLAEQFNIFLDELRKGGYRNTLYAIQQSGAQIQSFKFFVSRLIVDAVISKDVMGYISVKKGHIITPDDIKRLIGLRYEYTSNKNKEIRKKRQSLTTFVDELPKHMAEINGEQKRVVLMEDIITAVQKRK